MEYILKIMNEECYFSGNMFQCTWYMHHFSGTSYRNYCYNYDTTFILCNSCKHHSAQLKAIINEKSMFFEILTHLEQRIKKLETKRYRKNTAILPKPTPKPTFLSESSEEDISPDSPLNHGNLQPEENRDDIKAQNDPSEESIITEKTRLIPILNNRVKFEDEIEMRVLKAGSEKVYRN